MAQTRRADAYREAQLSMIGLNRFDAALDLENQAKKLGVAPSGLRLAEAYLAGQDEVVEEEIEAIKRAPSPASLAAYALYLDNTGEMNAAAEVWRQAANGTSDRPDASARESLLAQGAMNRAMWGDCRQARELARENGLAAASVSVNMRELVVDALCQDPSQATGMRERRSGEDLAATALADHNPSDPGVGAAGRENLLLVYLRARADVTQGRWQPAADGFQAILSHRGAALLSGTNIYPLAEAGFALSAARAKASQASEGVRRPVQARTVAANHQP
jgi:eukaryotic-like serine/threonine-protein kinase